jgi:hypothetical protein
MRPAGTMHVTFTAPQASNQKLPKVVFGTPGIKSWGFLLFGAYFRFFAY